MIRINLLGEDGAQDNSGLVFVGSWAASVAFLLLVCFFIQSSLNAALEKSKAESARLESELTELKKKTKEVEKLEKLRKDLNAKISVIARLKLSKRGPVRVVDDLNLSIPEKAWIMAVKEKSGELRIEGKALDNQTIAEFMKELEKSDYYTSVDLVETKQATHQGVKVKSFSLRAGISYAGKIELDTEAESKAS